jgi:hypothetical protein
MLIALALVAVATRPVGTGGGEPPETVVDALPELFVIEPSASLAMAPATLVKEPLTVGLATIVTTAEAPDPRVPTGHVTVPPFEAQPAVEPAATKLTPGGRTSVTVTPLAVLGPLLKTVIV